MEINKEREQQYIMTQNSKDIIIYSTAILMVLSGIILAFCSFFTLGDVVSGVLFYLSEALVFAGSIFGVSIYFYNQFGQFKSQTKQELSDFVHTKLDNKDKK